MPTIKREWCEITKSVINEAQEKLQEQLVSPLHDELPGISLQEVAADFFRKMRELMGFANEISISLGARSPEMPELPNPLVPLFKALFLRARLAKARELDQQRSKTTNPLVISALEGQLNVYDGLIREEWFQEAVPEYPLSLSDVLTLERAEHLDAGSSFPQRQDDEKFHILQAPALFLPDLHYYRGKCRVRMIPVSIAFLDIDKFKEDFNSELGETHVDRHVLPVFMRALEAHIYGHGFAYRFGGDEYALLMPNADADLALTFVSGLRNRVTGLRFVGTDKVITISVGLCVADRDCHLTDGELLQRAEQAKNYAKKEGRDRVAGYTSRLFDDTTLRVLAPTAEEGG
jgi:diguanylate cyclase (GGDEF)-like protein